MLFIGELNMCVYVYSCIVSVNRVFSIRDHLNNGANARAKLQFINTNLTG